MHTSTCPMCGRLLADPQSKAPEDKHGSRMTRALQAYRMSHWPRRLEKFANFEPLTLRLLVEAVCDYSSTISSYTMRTKLIPGACAALAVLLLNVKPQYLICGAQWLLGALAVLFTAVLIRVALFKDPSFSYPTAIVHYVIFKFLKTLGSFYNWREKRWSTSVKAVQSGVLRSILKLNGKTEYGRAYNLADVKTREDFVKRHPLTKYDHYAEYVQRMVACEKNVLTKDEPIYYGQTSGTTGKPSTIPIVKFMMRGSIPYVTMPIRISNSLLPIGQRYQRWMRLFYNPTRLLTKTPSGVFMGPISAAAQRTFLVQRDVYTTPLSGFEIPDNAAAQYVHVLFGLRHRNLATIDALFASLVYYAFRTMEHSWREMVLDIRQGSLNSDLRIPDEIRAVLIKKLTPMPERADELETEFSKGFDNIAKRIWPKLSLIMAIASGSFQQYATILREKFTKDVPIYTPYYASTEAHFGYNRWPERQGDDVQFILAVKAIFFEFLPVDNAGDAEPQSLFADQVERGKDYELVLTNFGGLYRYRIGDVVRVVDFYQQIPVIQYIHRSSQQLNIRGEKVSEDTLLAAVGHLNTIFSAQHEFSRITDFSSCESVLLETGNDVVRTSAEDQPPYYLIFLELQGLIEENRRKLEDDLGAELDRYLMESQSEGYGYRYYRDKGSVGPTRVILVKPGGFQRLRHFMLNNSTTSPSQLKIPRVITKPALVQFLCNDSAV